MSVDISLVFKNINFWVSFSIDSSYKVTENQWLLEGVLDLKLGNLDMLSSLWYLRVKESCV